MPTSPSDWLSLQQGVQSMRRAGQEQQMRGLLGEATQMMGQPGGMDFQGMMGLAQKAPDPMQFVQKLGLMQQMRQKEILQQAGGKIAQMYSDGQFDANELKAIDEEFKLGIPNIIELAKMVKQTIMPEPEAYTLAPGAARFQGDQVIGYNPPAGNAPEIGKTREIKKNGKIITQEYTPTGWKQIADSPRWDPTRNEQTVYGPDGQILYRQGPAGGAQKQIGTIPPGYRAIRDKAGNVTGMEAIPGGPAEIEAQEKAAQVETALEGQAKAAQTVFEDVERSLEVIDNFGRGATGIMGLTDFLPETPSNRLNQHIKSIQGNIGIDKLLEIKKSGAGLGQVPQAQLEMLASVLGRLDTKMNKEDLVYNLKRVQEIYADIVKKNGQDPNAVYKERLDRIGGQSSRINTATDYMNKFNK